MIIGFIIFIFVGLIMIGIGISSIQSQNPTGFYTGEKIPTASELTDVISWNKKHGIMWIIYGFFIIISYIIGMFIKDSSIILVVVLGGEIVPLPFMAFYHHQLKKEYLRRNYYG